MKKYVKGPMIAGIVLQAVTLMLEILLYFTQDMPGLFSSVPGSIRGAGKVFPVSIVVCIIFLATYVIFMLVMSSFEGSSYRGAAAAMIVAWLILSILSPYVSALQNVFTARRGSDAIAAMGILTSRISYIAAPFSHIAGVLVIVAVGRFGIENEYREPAAPVGIDPAQFGNGYTIQ